MNWEGECYLLSKKKFKENANIINIFSQNKGKISGLVYGGNSRKIRNYLQVSNKLFVIHNSKSENKMGYFKTELVKPVSPLYFSDKERTSALLSLCSILNSLLPEAQPNKNIYKSFEKFINSIGMENWIILYIFFELSLIKYLGFDPNLEKFKESSSNESKLKKIKIDNFYYEIPIFIIQQKLPLILNNNLIRKSLYFTRSIIQNKFFTPNNILFPQSRILLENYYN